MQINQVQNNIKEWSWFHFATNVSYSFAYDVLLIFLSMIFFSAQFQLIMLLLF